MRAVERLVQAHRGEQPTLQSIARSLGVSEIVEQKLPFEGGIFLDGEKLVIKISSVSPDPRRRFTLAHEIGHLMLASLLKLAADCTTDADMERACDAIAAELLMPAQETISFVKRQGDASPERLKLIAEAFAVSLHTAALRVHRDLKLWRRLAGIGMWRFERTAEEVWFVGKRPWKSRREHFSAFESALASRETILTQETYADGDRTRSVLLRVLNLGNKHLLALVS